MPFSKLIFCPSTIKYGSQEAYWQSQKARWEARPQWSISGTYSWRGGGFADPGLRDSPVYHTRLLELGTIPWMSDRITALNGLGHEGAGFNIWYTDGHASWWNLEPSSDVCNEIDVPSLPSGIPVGNTFMLWDEEAR